MRLPISYFATGAAVIGLFALAACHNTAATDDSVTNVVIDNTVGTASDAMTDVDATVGAAANMAADVGDSAASNTATAQSDADAEPAKPAKRAKATKSDSESAAP